jgi:L-threonylcarbamoyladenylate synthase
MKIFEGSNDLHLREAGEMIRGGGVVAIPTETVYGLAANAADASAVRRIFAIKGRPQDNPLITHIASPEDLYSLCNGVTDTALTLARRFWPGALTLVLPSKGAVCSEVTAGLDTVAVRCPAHPIARAVIRYAQTPIAAPSANPSGRPSPTSAGHVMEDYPGNTAGLCGVVDGGRSAVGVESTVLDLSGETPCVLRYGGIGADKLREILPNLTVQTRPKDNLAKSPGQKHRHYAPETPLVLLPEHIDEAVETVIRGRKNCAVLCPDAEEGYFMCAVTYGSTPEEMAARLFDALRKADATGAEVLYARVPAGGGILEAVRDRLIRAAEQPATQTSRDWCTPA